MKKRQGIAKSLVALGCLIVLGGAALHMIAAYPKVSTALAASNLETILKNALRAVFLMIGGGWIALAAVTLVAAFTETQVRKVIVLLCGFALLLQIPVWVHLMGWFIGNEMFTIAGGLVVIGGLLFDHGRTA